MKHMFGLNVGAVAAPYINYKNERSTRRFRPLSLYFGSNEWHPEPQWLMDAWDVDKQAVRTFALAGFLDGAPELDPIPRAEDYSRIEAERRGLADGPDGGTS